MRISILKHRIFYTLLLIAVSGLLVALFYGHSDPEPIKKRELLLRNYRIVPVPLPARMQFAGEEVPMDDAEVRERFDRELLINTYWQSSTLLMIKKTRRAFEVMEPILEKEGIPEDFKYLAVIESGLANVVSPSGAAGYWQFLKSTGEQYGLEINDDIDERYHLIKSTEAACRLLKDAYQKFGNWTLAAAAYNRGISGIQRAVENQKEANFYQLFLNSETSRYVFRILALKLIIENPRHYGFIVDDHDYYRKVETYTQITDTSIQSLPDLAKHYQTNYKMLKELNPWLMGYKLPVKKGRNYTLTFPLLMAEGNELKK